MMVLKDHHARALVVFDECRLPLEVPRFELPALPSLEVPGQLFVIVEYLLFDYECSLELFLEFSFFDLFPIEFAEERGRVRGEVPQTFLVGDQQLLEGVQILDPSV